MKNKIGINSLAIIGWVGKVKDIVVSPPDGSIRKK